MKKGTFRKLNINLAGRDELQYVEGFSVEVLGLKDFTFYAYQESKRWWRFVNHDTGQYIVTEAKTRKDAVERGREMLARYGHGRVRELLQARLESTAHYRLVSYPELNTAQVQS